MRPLRVIFWVVGVLCALAIVPLFLPMSIIELMCNAFKIETVPVGEPLFIYTLRSLFGLCAAIGVYHVLVAREIERYGVLVPFTGIAWIFFGAVCGVVGGVAQLPPYVFLGDAIFSFTVGVLILVFWGLTRPGYHSV